MTQHPTAYKRGHRETVMRLTLNSLRAKKKFLFLRWTVTDRVHETLDPALRLMLHTITLKSGTPAGSHTLHGSKQKHILYLQFFFFFWCVCTCFVVVPTGEFLP